MKQDTKAFAREEYNRIVKAANERGIKILTKYRKGLKNIKVEPIVLSESMEGANVHH